MKVTPAEMKWVGVLELEGNIKEESYESKAEKSGYFIFLSFAIEFSLKNTISVSSLFGIIKIFESLQPSFPSLEFPNVYN